MHGETVQLKKRNKVCQCSRRSGLGHTTPFGTARCAVQQISRLAADCFASPKITLSFTPAVATHAQCLNSLAKERLLASS